jgi:hypothetical protein
MISHAGIKRLATIAAWLMALGFLALVFFVPVAAAIIFLIIVAVLFAMNWKTEGKWKAIKIALWQLLTGW